MPPPRSRSPKRRFRGTRSAPRSGRHRSPLTRCRPCSEVKALRALLDRQDKLAAENRCLLDELQLLKDEHAGATKSALEGLKNDLIAKDADMSRLQKDLAEARTHIDALPKELSDVISASALTEEQTRLRFRLLAQQFEQSICRQQPGQPRVAQFNTEPEVQPPPPQQPTAQQTMAVEADDEQPSSAGPSQLPRVNDLAETDSYDSSSSSSDSDGENPPFASGLGALG